ncbi:type I restriction endonuclease subunit R [Pseudonocardia acidicola]|uniref:Type I restriction enzyme endonuclease subunit n=1 Tax=Pseudonocardia acidicola TaxID=2724939 RepID=A0ABX1S8V1_9PSEU|nr:type I restriction endonuclease subunit R [Pseudonocardia acidicola]NMH97989.1 type I restriction endonuclease subunit R [Pseudonocardia acidicola]
MSGMSEEEWERLAKDTLGELSWNPVEGKDIAPGSDERQSWDDLVLRRQLLDALRRLNPDVPGDQLQQAYAEITSPRSNDAISENHRVHDWLVGGYRGITYLREDGQETTPTIRLISQNVDENTWIVANQVTVRHKDFHRRFDLVLFCNGMPVSILELKKAGSATADPSAAHAQLQTYITEFPIAFRFALLTVISDGVRAEYGTPFTELHHFAPWNVDEEGAVVEPGSRGRDGEPVTALELLLHGVFEQERFLQLLRWYTAFDQGAVGLAKRIAKPHQYFAVAKAVGSTVEAFRSDGKAGVVWHTQGSGKSMEMELYANRIMRQPELANPTIVVITDRNELDGQLYQSFQISQLLPEQPVQIKRRSELRERLTNQVTGGIYFTTLQKFGRTKEERDAGADHPELSARKNIIVIVDEAHRSHYDDLDGYARHLKKALPHASLIAFTGTPISFADRNTRAVFGDYVDVYDLSRAVEDGATVPVYFEPRLIKLARREDMSDEDLDRSADEATKGLDDTERAQIEKSVAVINAVYGDPKRLDELVKDLLAHWDRRREAMRPTIAGPGKAMIVGGTRLICAEIYRRIAERRPEWDSKDIHSGKVKVVYSSDATDTGLIADHRRRPSENATIKERFRDPDDELEIVIVKDMMLTGYDSPPLHTLYLDRPLKGALLMQTLARVNRTFRGKEAGLLVGYAPVADNLQKALAEYSPRDQQTKPMGREVDDAAEVGAFLVGQIREALADYDWRAKLRSGQPRAFLRAALATTDYLRSPTTPGNKVPEGEETLADRYRRLSGQLARAWALCGASGKLEELRPDILFFEEVRVYMAKYDADARRAEGKPVPEEISRLLAALLTASTETGEVIDIYEAAGMPKPELSDLNPAYVTKAQQATNPQLAIEALRKLVLTESTRVTRSNVVRERVFSERVKELMIRYTNQQLTSAQVIAELVELAKEIRKEAERGATFTPPLDDDQLAFYDAVAQNESAVLEQGDDVLAQIARDLVGIMRRDVRTDWTVRDDVRAKLRSSIKRLLVKHKYPPDKQPGAIALVLEQMERLAPRFVDAA